MHTRTSATHPRIGHIRAAKPRVITARLSRFLSLSPLSLSFLALAVLPLFPQGAPPGFFLLFGRHPATHDSLPPSRSAAPSAKLVARPFHHVDQEHLEVFRATSRLDVFSSRSSSESCLFTVSLPPVTKEEIALAIARRSANVAIRLVPRFNRSRKASSLNVIPVRDLYAHQRCGGTRLVASPATEDLFTSE